ncbi:MAG TPA: hypothetical protein VH482_33015 [Thermomicrobiales bacterium]
MLGGVVGGGAAVVPAGVAVRCGAAGRGSAQGAPGALPKGV